MNNKLLAASILLMVVSFKTFSQQTRLTGGNIGLSYSASSHQSFKDTAGSFSIHSIRANINLPLFGNLHDRNGIRSKSNSLKFFQVSAQGAIESSRSTISFIKDQRDFYTANVGFGGLYFTGKNILIADAAVGVASDDIAIKTSELRYRFSGSFIVNNIHSASVMYQYGLAFTYAYGRPLLLPVLGIRAKMSGPWSFSAILPLSVNFTDKLNKNMRLTFSLKPSGNRFQFQNQNDFATTSSTVNMQLRQFQLGASYLYRFAGRFNLGAEAGLVGRGKLKFTEPGDNKKVLYQTDMKGGARVRLSLHYLFPEKNNNGKGIDLDGEMLRVN